MKSHARAFHLELAGQIIPVPREALCFMQGLPESESKPHPDLNSEEGIS